MIYLSALRALATPVPDVDHAAQSVLRAEAYARSVEPIGVTVGFEVVYCIVLL